MQSITKPSEARSTETPALAAKVPCNSAPGGDSSSSGEPSTALTPIQKMVIDDVEKMGLDGYVRTQSRLFIDTLAKNVANYYKWKIDQMQTKIDNQEVEIWKLNCALIDVASPDEIEGTEDAPVPSEDEASTTPTDSHSEQQRADEVMQRNWIQAQIEKEARKKQKKLNKKMRKEEKERDRASRLRDEAQSRQRNTRREVSHRERQGVLSGYAQEREEQREERAQERRGSSRPRKTTEAPPIPKSLANRDTGEWAQRDIAAELEALKASEAAMQSQLDALCDAETEATKPRSPGQALMTDEEILDLEAQIEKLSADMVANQKEQERVSKLIK